jgi:hypothetical protein
MKRVAADPLMLTRPSALYLAEQFGGPRRLVAPLILASATGVDGGSRAAGVCVFAMTSSATCRVGSAARLTEEGVRHEEQ